MEENRLELLQLLNDKIENIEVIINNRSIPDNIHLEAMRECIPEIKKDIEELLDLEA